MLKKGALAKESLAVGPVENVGKSRRCLRDFSKQLWESTLSVDSHRCGIFHQATQDSPPALCLTLVGGLEPQHVGVTHSKPGRTLFYTIRKLIGYAEQFKALVQLKVRLKNRIRGQTQR